MSKFESRKKRESFRFDTEWIKFKVKIALFFFKKVQIEREQRDVNITMKRELKNWANANGLKICIKTVERPINIRGHSYYQINAKRHYTVISFSK